MVRHELSYSYLMRHVLETKFMSLKKKKYLHVNGICDIQNDYNLDDYGIRVVIV